MSDLYCIERTAKGISGISLESKLFERRVIYLEGEIDDKKVHELIKAITILESINTDPITMVVDSLGGSIRAGLSLVDIMEACTCEIRTVTIGIAASMAAIIAATGSKGKRYISKYSRFMIHEPLLQNGVAGSCSTIQATAKEIMERKNLINRMLADATGKDILLIEEATNHDNYMSAEESVAFGLVDRILEGKELATILRGEMVCI